MELADLFGYAGAVTATSFLVPQVWRTWQTKSVEDISWAMLILLVLNFIFWTIYGILTSALPVIVANSVAFVVSIVQVTLKFRYRNNP